MQNQWHENATFTINAIINVNAKTIRTTSFSSSNSSRSWFVLQIWMRASLSFMPSIRSFMPCTVTQYRITNQLTLLQDDIVHYHITDQNMMIPFAPFIIITSVKAEVVQSTALSVCEHDYCNTIIWFHWNLLLWLGLPIGRTDWLLVVIRTRIWILDHFSTLLTIVKQGIVGDLLAFLMQSQADFHDTDADKVMNPQYFGGHLDPN